MEEGSTQARLPRAPSSYNTAPTKLLTDANGFPSDLFQSPDLILWAWCLFLNIRIFQRQCPGQGMTGNSWHHGWTEKSPEWGQGGEFLAATGIMSPKLLSNLIPGLFLQVEILSTPTIGGSITWHKLSGQPSSNTNLARIWTECPLTQQFCFQESIFQFFLWNCAKIKV